MKRDVEASLFYLLGVYKMQCIFPYMEKQWVVDMLYLDANYTGNRASSF